MTTRNDTAGIKPSAKSAQNTGRSPGTVPTVCKWLGALGAVPFVATAVASHLLDGAAGEQAGFALAVYGAVILSFLGGIHWGLAIAGSADANLRRLTISVIPALVAWCALLLTGTAALLTLAVSFLLMLVLDLHATRHAEAPAWYPKLRWPLTVTVAACLIAGAYAP